MIEISIIVPTYNEKDNVGLLLERVHKSMKNFDYEIIIIDDNSPDGTSELVNKISKEYFVRLIVRRSEKGLASAIVEGFKNARGNIFVVMDADHQHPPEKITSLVEEIYKGSDIVVGSRYIEETVEESSFIRKAISRCANIPAKILFKELANVKDIQSGFFALRREVVENLDLNPRGYKILIEILVLGNYRNVKEISYNFSKRKYGKTKLGIGTIIDYVFHLAILSWRKGGLKRFIKFCFVGIIGIFVNTIILFFFTSIIGMFYILSSILAHEISIMTNFVVNDRWAFRELIADSRHSFLMRCIHYNWTRVIGVVLSIILLYFFTEFLSINYLISNVMAIMLGVIYGYSTAMTIVWRN